MSADHTTNENTYVSTVKEELKGYLEAYMDAHQIAFRGEGRGSFQCPNAASHSNQDKNFSGSFVTRSNGKRWKCHRCNEGGDIYDMAHFVEGLPVGSTKDFYAVTIPSVAESIGHDLDEDKYYDCLEESLGQVERKNVLTVKQLKAVNKTIRIRLNPQKINEDFGRTCPEEEREKISAEFQPFFPEEGDMDFLPEGHAFQDRDEQGQQKFIRSGCLVLPIHSRYGSLIGFSARRSKELIEQGFRKYIYSTSVSKNEKLNFFNVHRARRTVSASGLVYIFEAQWDCISAYMGGLSNSISTGASPDPDALVDILTGMQAREVVLILDRDKAGIDSTIKLYEKLTGQGFIVSIFQLQEGEDADEYVAKKGVGDFADPAQRVNVVKYILDNDYGYLSSTELGENAKYSYAVDYVVKFSRSVAMASMYAEILSERFGVKAIEDIHYDIVREMSNRKDPLVMRCNNLISERCREITHEPDIDRKVSGMDALNDELRQVYATHLSGSLSEEHKELSTLLSQGDESDRGRIMTGLYDVDEAVRIFPGTLIVVGGRPSAGKSTMMRAMVPRMIEDNPGLFVLHLSLDDTTQDTIDGIISNLSGIPNDVVESNRIRAVHKEALEDAQETIRSWWNKSYYLCGQEKISSAMDIRNMVWRAQIIAPDKRIVLIVDNLMNLPEVAEASYREKRTRVETAVNTLHRLTQSKKIATFALVELTKGGSYRPTAEMLKETGTTEYRAKIVAMLHNDLKANPDSKINWRDPQSEELWPVLEVEFPKNKVGSPHRRVYMRMDPSTNRFDRATDEQIRRWDKEVAMASSRKKGGEQTAEGDGGF